MLKQAAISGPQLEYFSRTPKGSRPDIYLPLAVMTASAPGTSLTAITLAPAPAGVGGRAATTCRAKSPRPERSSRRACAHTGCVSTHYTTQGLH